MYIVEGVIGQGQFSVVCKARDIRDGTKVALKKIHIPSMTSPQARADCLKEISLLQQLDHPNVIRYITSYIEGSELNIVLELADAGDLSWLIRHFRRSRRLIPENTIWRYFVQIASGLQHMHSKRVMHRDIKPANVFVTRAGVVKLGDLGLSRFFSAKTLAAQSLVGTPYYMSPERLHEQSYTFSSDIWSLGCLLYEIRPFDPEHCTYITQSTRNGRRVFTKLPYPSGEARQFLTYEARGFAKLAALQSPFYENRQNLYLLTRKIERGGYPPLPSDIYSSELRQLVSSCLQPIPDDRPDIEHVYSVALGMTANANSRPPPSNVSRRGDQKTS